MRTDHPGDRVTATSFSVGRLAAPAHIELALLGAMIPVEVAVFAHASQPLGATLFTLTAGAAATIFWDATRSVRDHLEAPGHQQTVAPPPAFAPSLDPASPGERLAAAIGRMHKLAGRVSIAVVTVRTDAAAPGDTLDLARRHVAATARRVSRSTDILVGLDDRRLALVLAGCDGADAAIFGQRLTVAVHNRPASGIDPSGLHVTTLEYDPARFGTPRRFLAAFNLAETHPASPVETSASRALDGHEIRRRILGEGFANYRPRGFGGLVRNCVARPLRVVA